MERVESNTINSFSLVRRDIMKLQDNFMELKVANARLLEKISKLEAANNSQVKIVRVNEKIAPKIKRKSTSKRSSRKQAYLATKDGKNFHDAGCIALKRADRKNLVSYPTKNKAISKGLQPCRICVPL